VPAFHHKEREWTIDGQSTDYMQAMMYTQWFNLLGNPAAVVPMSKSPEGLPIGVQVVGLPYQEELVLKIAAVIESAGGFEAPQLSA
jgi:Asp-tRNA(Asn)/Glu-tRNA(Gln) amidotransferase A subunit family amidase